MKAMSEIALYLDKSNKYNLTMLVLEATPIVDYLNGSNVNLAHIPPMKKDKITSNADVM